nr:hypothetical protein [Micromonospora sp. DSM 115978]
MRPVPPTRRITPVRLLRAVALSGLVGLLVGMLAIPTVGVLGLTAKGAADEFLALPANLISPPLPQPSRIVDSQGGEIAV